VYRGLVKSMDAVAPVLLSRSAAAVTGVRLKTLPLRSTKLAEREAEYN
jgi:hypothetical protein